MDPNSNSMLKIDLFSEIKKVAKKYKKVETQSERAELIFDLKVILETYKKYAAKLDKSGPPGKREMKCAQLAAYIARSINIIATQYDNKKVMDELKELWKIAAKLERKREKAMNSEREEGNRQTKK